MASSSTPERPKFPESRLQELHNSLHIYLEHFVFDYDLSQNPANPDLDDPQQPRKFVMLHFPSTSVNLRGMEVGVLARVAKYSEDLPKTLNFHTPSGEDREVLAALKSMAAGMTPEGSVTKKGRFYRYWDATVTRSDGLNAEDQKHEINFLIYVKLRPGHEGGEA